MKAWDVILILCTGNESHGYLRIEQRLRRNLVGCTGSIGKDLLQSFLVVSDFVVSLLDGFQVIDDRFRQNRLELSPVHVLDLLNDVVEDADSKL